jgi:hypothetical protein
MASFQAVFCVPTDHRLELVKSRSRGGLFRGEYWVHEEFDENGNLVARYESFSESDPQTGSAQNGWCRYAGDGRLLERHQASAPLFESQ